MVVFHTDYWHVGPLEKFLSVSEVGKFPEIWTFSDKKKSGHTKKRVPKPWERRGVEISAFLMEIQLLEGDRCVDMGPKVSP